MFRLNILPKQYFDLIDGYYNIVQMSKWNKPNKPLSEEFIENEQRRKQIIIEAARRRKDKEKKIQQEDERDKRQEEEALKRHKQQKKDAYIKYLHNNLHDKYEQLQRMKKEAKPQIKSNAKWKKKTPQQNSNQLEALDLEVKMDPPAQFDLQSIQEKQISIIQQPNAVKQQRKELIQQFQKQWVLQQSKDELLGSKLLDSLDLDIDTINRGKQVKQIMRQQPKNDQIKELRQLIGYESVLFAQQQAQKQQQKPEIKTSKQAKETKPNKQTNKASKNVNTNATKTQEINEVEALNQLRRKKQAKILNWAIQQQQEAEDLFSNCSTKKKSNQALKELNEELKISKQSKPNTNKVSNNLPTIAQETVKSNQVVNQPAKSPVQTSNQAPKTPIPLSNQPPSQRSSRDKQQNQRQAVISTQPNFKKVQKRTSVQREESADKKKQVEIKEARQTKKPSKTTSGFTSQKNLIRMRTTSRDKPKNQSKQKKQQKLPPLKVVQAPKKLGGQLPPLPARNENNSIATHDLQIDIESFIKQDLLNLNQEQMKIQQQLRRIHKDHKNGIKEVYNKYEIKTDYKHSSQLTGQQPAKVSKYYQNEQDIEQSLQNLDNILIRKELVTRQKQAIKEETQEDSQSFINPFSNSQDLCNQVLKLAKNVSRFDVKPEQPSKDGYQYMSKAKKGKSNEKIQQKSRVSKGKEQQQQGLSQSQDVSHVSSALGKPPNILMNNFNTQEKIHVNAKLLKNLLLDDD